LRQTLDPQVGNPVWVAATSCIAALTIALLLFAEHRRALQSSALTSLYLLITFLYDVARAKAYYFHMPVAGRLTSLAAAGAIFKLCLLFLLEISKRGLIQDPQIRQNASDEAVSGFWSRSFLVWLHSTLFLGFRTIISVDDLGALDPDFSSQALSERLEHSLRKSESIIVPFAPFTSSLLTPYLASVSWCWLIAGFVRTFPIECFLSAIPRLSFIGFKFYQPLFIQHVITYVSEQGSSRLTSLGLIGQGVLIFFGIAVSTWLYRA
jgi:hypothetical protein